MTWNEEQFKSLGTFPVRDWRDALAVSRWVRQGAHAADWRASMVRRLELLCWELARLGCELARQAPHPTLRFEHDAEETEHHLYLLLGPVPATHVRGGSADELDLVTLRDAASELEIIEDRDGRRHVRVNLKLPPETALPLPGIAEPSRDEEETPEALLRILSEQHQQELRLDRQLEQREQQAQQLTHELEETNRGVVALYAELEDRAGQLRELNATLEQRVAERTEALEERARQLRAVASQLSQAESRERRRIAQMLHDGLQQLLVAGKMRIGLAQQRAGDKELAESLGQISDLIDESIQASRNLTTELAPPVLFKADLKSAMAWLGERMLEKHGLRVTVSGEAPPEPVPDDLRVLVFQITQELLFNVVKHAGTDEAEVILTPSEDQLQITVADRGRGFDMAAPPEHQDGTGFGLLSVRERVGWYGGQMAIDSEPGRGTSITLCVPIGAQAMVENCPNASP